MRRLAAIALALMALAAPGTAEAAPTHVVASAWVEGTYSLPGVLGYRTLHFTLYADGRLLTTGEVDARGVTTYEVARISPRESRRMRELLVRATDGVDFGDVPVADVGYTRTRVVLDGRLTTSLTNALQMDTGLTPAQTQARERRLERAHRVGGERAHGCHPQHLEPVPGRPSATFQRAQQRTEPHRKRFP